ncbi:MAG: biosynthetic-type acetolactate synthase large subunit [Chloroflexota bacterium]|nr:biosynthetic-type acetolactate synthase large subunit [Chloroflexota bacterium]
MERTGAQIVWESMLLEGIDVIFGHPGGAILPTYDALPQYPIRHILVRHEQCAAHMADGYARATGKVGACIATSGPGATNLITGLATAMMDSVPIVAVTGQVPTSMLGNDAFQETDVTGVSMPVTKHNYLVTDVKDLAEVMAEAFYVARTGRPGPVLVDICKDVQNDSTEFQYPEKLSRPGLHKMPEFNPADVSAAADLMNAANKPLFMVGHGVQMGGAEQELLALVEKADIPVVTTLLGLGAIPETHPLVLGMSGMHGEAATNHAVQECDVLIAVGMRFDDRVTGRLDEFAPRAKIVHFEMDPSEIGKNVSPDLAVLGDCKQTLGALVPQVENIRHPEWRGIIQGWQEETYRLDIADQEVDELIPPFVMRQLWHVTGGDSLIVTDVGQHQMWEAQYFTHERPRQLLTSGGLGTMGYGMPAAMGAKVGMPDELVWAVVGDGGFQMTLQELGTIAQEQIAVKIGIMNNGFLGMVRQWQQLFYDKRYAGTPILSPDYVKLADAYGIPALRVTSNDEVAGAIKQANEYDGPFLVEFRIKEEVNVYPMVPAGANVGQMIRRPEPAIVQGYSGVKPSW